MLKVGDRVVVQPEENDKELMPHWEDEMSECLNEPATVVARIPRSSLGYPADGEDFLILHFDNPLVDFGFSFDGKIAEDEKLTKEFVNACEEEYGYAINNAGDNALMTKWLFNSRWLKIIEKEEGYRTFGLA